MNKCPNCGHPLVRTHRTHVQKLLFSDAFRCSHCNYRDLWLRPAVDINLSFLFSRFTRCVRCGNRHVYRLTERDHLDAISKHPTSLLCGLTGAPLRKCPFCRLQYYDWRPPATAAVRRASQQP